MITLTTELSQIKGLGTTFITKLKKLGVENVRDLLWHFPTRYEDFSRIVPIAELQAGQSATISGVIKKIDTKRTWKRHMVIVEAIVADESGGMKALWFNQPYIGKILRVGQQINFAGKITGGKDGLYFSNPSYEAGNKTETQHTAGLIPIYPETKGLTSRGIRYLVKPLLQIIKDFPECIPDHIREQYELPEIIQALHDIHFPAHLASAERARKRFAFEDLFLLGLNNIQLREKLKKESAPSLTIGKEEYNSLLKLLPFTLTPSQIRSLEEILKDIAKKLPMNRLLQGDVGSGKTIVAALVALVTVKNNKQTAIMAPTEVLARQHYTSLTNVFKTADVSIGLITASEIRIFYGEHLESSVTRAELLNALVSGKINIIIGTHALIAKGKNARPILFYDLGLFIIDEQHRFGVEQRAELVAREKKNAGESSVHFLSMSATPIPRTLSLTLFGDLDVSSIDELPRGRKKIITKIVAPENREKAYAFIREHIAKGRQVFVICPRITASELPDVSPASFLPEQKRKIVWAEVKNVTEEYERLSRKIFPDFTVAMLHGKLKSSEKKEIMNNFRDGKINLLVSTSVVEVGVDVPNATIMVIEGADRFGLAQLYQFRGRIGRGEHQSFCLLFSDSETAVSNERLTALINAKNGFELAELDLRLRGPGEFLGEKQTGLPDLAMKALNNMELVQSAREAAKQTLKEDPTLKTYPILKQKLSLFKKTVHLE